MKRQADQTEPAPKRQKTEVSEEDVNYVIEHLTSFNPTPKVALDYANHAQAQTDVKAYAKLAGPGWTYYVQQTEVVIGRSSPEENVSVSIDLHPCKVASRRHAAIRYFSESQTWGVEILGRNGIKIDKQTHKQGTIQLKSGNVLDVGGVQMMFVLPGQTPEIAPEMLPPKEAYPNGVAIITKPQVRGVSLSYTQDYSKDDCKDIKPPYSYATMISQAILSTDEMMMSLAEIYEWISSRYSYYRHSKTGWQNSIRHNLSLNKAFEKVPRKAHEPGKGMKWQINEEYLQEYTERAANGGKPKKRKQETPTSSASSSPVKLAAPQHHTQYPVSQLSYTPERGSSKPVPSTKLYNGSSTPAPQPAQLSLAPPSGQGQLPSSFMGSSPAPFWKLITTPIKDDSPTKYSKKMDLQDVDLTRGFRQIGK